MPHTSSARKAKSVAERQRSRNKPVKSAAKTQITKAERFITSGELEPAAKAVTKAISTLDRAAEKGVIHANAAARRKSRLVKKLNQAASASKK